MPLSTGTRLGAYEILAAIGKGGMGEVFQARDTKLGRDVAIKVLPDHFAGDPDRLARFGREARLLASLNHPNIAAIYGIEESTRVHALVLELVEGPTLAERLASGSGLRRAQAAQSVSRGGLRAPGMATQRDSGPGPRSEARRPTPAGGLPLDEALPIARQIADALEYAHEQNVIHRDLKPANVKVRADGMVKVLDFGLAKLTEAGSGLTAQGAGADSQAPTMTSPAMVGTVVGAILGTAAYMSPEQAKGRTADRRSDIWAFGAVVYEMLTGRRAFPGDDLSETLASVIKSEPDWGALPPDTPAAIRRLLRRCLQKDRSRRLQTAGDARLEIDEALAEPDAAESPAGAVAPRISRTRERVAWAAAGILLLALGALAWAFAREAPASDRPVHLSIALPEDAEVRSLALSPDGQSIVVAAQMEGKYQLWVRHLDAPEFRPLNGTTLARVPFWSPDSRSIGFFADNKLKTIPASGGPARVLCDLSNTGGGGTWNRDGTILFAAFGGDGIHRVPASGGDCAPLTRPETGSSHVFPEFLPDGRHFLYVVTNGDESKRGVYVSPLDSPNGQRVLADQSSVAYVPPSTGQRIGSLIFLRDSMLMAQPFDAATLHAEGDVVEVARHASRSNTLPQMAAAVSAAKALVFIANATGSSGLQLAWLDRSGRELGKVGAPRLISAVALAPDEKAVATSGNDLNAISSNVLWLTDLGRNTTSRFTSPSAPSFAPVWSPDGRRIVYRGIRPGSSGQDLYWQDVGGTQETLLFKSGGNKSPSDWSRDGRSLIYTDTDPKTGADIWILPNVSDASAAQKPIPFAQTLATESLGQLSPDGHWIAYFSDESGQGEVYVRPFPSGSGRWQVSNAGGSEPRWRRDGKELFYEEGLLGRFRVMAVSADLGSSQPSFGSPKSLFEFRTIRFTPQSNQFSYAPSADGQRFLLTRLASDVRPTLDVLMNWQKMLPSRP